MYILIIYGKDKVNTTCTLLGTGHFMRDYGPCIWNARVLHVVLHRVQRVKFII